MPAASAGTFGDAWNKKPGMIAGRSIQNAKEAKSKTIIRAEAHHVEVIVAEITHKRRGEKTGVFDHRKRADARRSQIHIHIFGFERDVAPDGIFQAAANCVSGRDTRLRPDKTANTSVTASIGKSAETTGAVVCGVEYDALIHSAIGKTAGALHEKIVNRQPAQASPHRAEPVDALTANDVRVGSDAKTEAGGDRIAGPK